MDTTNPEWPALPYGPWRETCTTLHLWTQIVGKVRLAHTPWLNHGWHVPLYVSVNGLSTSLISCGLHSFAIRFNFREHVLEIDTSDGAGRRLPLRAQSVASFYAALMGALDELGFSSEIDDRPCEIAGAIPFSRDEVHGAYDAESVQRFWRVLLQVDRVFKLFRTGFIGKASPVHFFWGSFDLAVTRFSGRRAPPFQGKAPGLATRVMQEAYSHEVSSAGFWPGSEANPDPCFYSYAYPEPAGYRDFAVRPSPASFSEQLGEYVLLYDRVRESHSPQTALLSFLQSTYEAAADNAHWDRTALERPLGSLGFPSQWRL